MGRLIFTCPASPAWWYISPKFLPTFISAGFPLNMKASVSEWEFWGERFSWSWRAELLHTLVPIFHSQLHFTWQLTKTKTEAIPWKDNDKDKECPFTPLFYHQEHNLRRSKGQGGNWDLLEVLIYLHVVFDSSPWCFSFLSSTLT